MPSHRRSFLQRAGALALGPVLSACATGPRETQGDTAPALTHRPEGPVQRWRWLDRLSWGAQPSGWQALRQQGEAAWLAAQLRPAPLARLPEAAQRQVDALSITQTPADTLWLRLEAQRRAADAQPDEEARKAAQQAYQQAMNLVAREATQRAVWRALYSPQQVQEQMVWFWCNHFHVFQGKANLRALVGDYEERAVRPHALGRFRDLLGAVVRHPAMLRYLDNEHNAAGRLNENFARELMELHTLGVDGGYTQRDVQELARVLTGVGVVLPDAPPPRLRPEWQALWVRQGAFEFNPARHDSGPNTLLGAPLRAQGLAELDEALDRLARAPATARHVCRQLARFWVADEPPPALVERLAGVFLRSQGDIAQVLRALVDAPEFLASLGRKFRDPVHFVLAGLRFAYDDRVILNPNPVLGWVARLGQPWYGRVTPDGYPLDQAAWSGSGQMAARFEVARAMASGPSWLFRTEAPPLLEQPAFPQLSNALYHEAVAQALGPPTRQALAQATSAQDWGTLLLSSPEFMHR